MAMLVWLVAGTRVPRLVFGACVLALAGGSPVLADGVGSGADFVSAGQPSPCGSEPGFAISLMPVGPGTLDYGQTVSFRLASARDGFAHLYSIDPAGRVMAWAENLPVAAGVALTYPVSADALTMRAGPPAGTEQVILLVTERTMPGFGGVPYRKATMPMVLPTAAGKFLRNLEEAIHGQRDRSWARTDLQIRIVDPALGGG